MTTPQTATRPALLRGGIPEHLTAREREVLALLADGLTARQIASRLVISERTVNTHVLNLYRKLHVNNRAEAIAAGVRGGILQLEAPKEGGVFCPLCGCDRAHARQVIG